MLQTLYLIRYGESTANVGGAAVLDKLIELTARGQEQAQTLLQRLDGQHTTAVYTSEMRRTQQTAQAMCERWQLSAQVLPCLNEMCPLDFDRIAHVSVEERRRLAKEYWLQAACDYQDGPLADSFTQFDARVDAFLQLAPSLPNHSMLFTHGIWIGLLAWKLMGFAVTDVASKTKFRQFQTAMNMKNTVVYRLCSDSDTGLRQLAYYA
ncbi:histidine phosphatase family protein [Vitreoscilla massiliensis]|uniref:Histidine phosphatase family protein n=1 Tax=Vitreoscilla massiliensis TaxID=1689272 RepID=A0ABY4E1J4_9NEIS|nr:histidine phosphatase family protein [Vitreoscilla massiliensis]UOO89211.1 histidine phosphatase family protein [Vitreoscilla massiliensis]